MIRLTNPQAERSPHVQDPDVSVTSPPPGLGVPAAVVYRGITAYRITDRDGHFLAVGSEFTATSGGVATVTSLARGPEYNGTSKVLICWTQHTVPAWIGQEHAYNDHVLGLKVERIFEDLTQPQAEGLACVRCTETFAHAAPRIPAGITVNGVLVFGCGPLHAPVCDVVER